MMGLYWCEDAEVSSSITEDAYSTITTALEGKYVIVDLAKVFRYIDIVNCMNTSPGVQLTLVSLS